MQNISLLDYYSSQSGATILEQFRVENCVVSELSFNLLLGTSGHTMQSGARC